eukprot:9082549-Heterocapsa_arctica.AAC.1
MPTSPPLHDLAATRPTSPRSLHDLAATPHDPKDTAATPDISALAPDDRDPHDLANRTTSPRTTATPATRTTATQTRTPSPRSKYANRSRSPSARRARGPAAPNTDKQRMLIQRNTNDDELDKFMTTLRFAAAGASGASSSS